MILMPHALKGIFIVQGKEKMLVTKNLVPGVTVYGEKTINVVEGVVFAVEYTEKYGRNLVKVAQKRSNIISIVEDAWYPHKYQMLLGIVDVIFSDVTEPDQARIVAINTQNYLKVGGYFLLIYQSRILYTE